jgi:DNA-binding beta-propeller fold protein YncE
VRTSWRLVAVTAVLALAACTVSPSKTRPAGTPKAAAVPGVGCSTATAAAPKLPAADVRFTSVPGNSFGVAVTADGRWSFVSAPSGPASFRSGGMSVFANSGAAVPRLVRSIPEPGVLGVTLTHNGRYLLAATGTGAMVFSARQAEQGRPALLGVVTNPPSVVHALQGGGAIEVVVSPDDRFAFVSLEYADEIAVFNLQRALASGLRATGFVGDVPMGIAPVGMAVSPDGRWLYATSELASTRAARGGLRGGLGTLSVISVRKAETDPAHSVVATVPAGCSPVRVITSADGSVVWVTARASDMLLAFSAARLLTDPAHPLIARVKVGEAPVGLALVGGGERVVVADSNRFGLRGASSNLAVVNVAAALAGRPALAGYLPAGGFPRQMALEPDGRTLLVTNFASQQLEAVDVANLP